MRNFGLAFVIGIKNMFCGILNFFTKQEYFVDTSGVVLNSKDNGNNCKGNGNSKNRRGKYIECCCDECERLGKCTDNLKENIDN